MDYQDLTNRIKTNFSAEWLTPSQNQIFTKILEGYKAHKIVNIFGKPGVGKTFLGWNLNRVLASTYTKDIKVDNLCSIVILDDYSHTKNEIRQLLPIMQFQKISKIILITNMKALDDVVSLELKFNEDDKMKFKSNIFKNLGLRFENEKEAYNMHGLIKNNL